MTVSRENRMFLQIVFCSCACREQWQAYPQKCRWSHDKMVGRCKPDLYRIKRNKTTIAREPPGIISSGSSLMPTLILISTRWRRTERKRETEEGWGLPGGRARRSGMQPKWRRAAARRPHEPPPQPHTRAWRRCWGRKGAPKPDVL